ncbi:vitelline membrane outer layer 1 -like protein [Brachionus plicatilis]|uniref:Vitelline membrane outer layer 1-like protein n=1 Tax=Brachionus plicatilis TaxID=10195 RepID=A0A3M7SZK0_BRAPC|nr:vitelline membrane outer layer 1 -like protein [Brachionus plicatilis]
MIKLFFVFFFISYASILEINCREYITVIGSDRHTNWGDWHDPVFCPGYSFAVGVDIKFERYVWAGDDTHLNAIRLTCDDTASTKVERVHLENDILGLLGESAKLAHFFTKEQLSNGCDNMGKFIGFKFEAEPRISGDDTAGNMITMYCEGKGSVWFNLQYFGTKIKETKKYCPDGQAICGIRTQIEPKVKGDNTALNNVDFYCCKNFYKLFNIATKKP